MIKRFVPWLYNPLQKADEDVLEWGAKTFPNSSYIGVAKHLAEEALELVVALKQFEKDPIKSWEDVAEEIADVHILFIQLCAYLGVDDQAALAKLVQKKLAKLKTRKWQAPDADGIIRHVKERTVNGKI